jgi:hypothetical protein
MTSELVSLPLANSVLCVDCETISNSDSVCPKCGGRTLRPLSSWIGTLGHPDDRAVMLPGPTVSEWPGIPEVVFFKGRSVGKTMVSQSFVNRELARELIAKHRAALAEDPVAVIEWERNTTPLNRIDSSIESSIASVNSMIPEAVEAC